MNLTTKLSFSTCYYIRKIFLQHSQDVQWITEQNNGFCVSSSQDLKQLLDSVYLEEILEELLQRLYGENNEVSKKIQELEALCLSHQELVAKNLNHTEKMLGIQQKLFWLLGFKRIEIKIAEIVDCLNQLSTYSSNYLGTKLTTNNWQSNRPNVDWLHNFTIAPSAKFTFSGTITEVESFVQLQWMHQWVKAFVCQHTKTFRDFPHTIEQKKLGEVKEGLLLTRIGAYSAWLNVDTKSSHSWLN